MLLRYPAEAPVWITQAKQDGVTSRNQGVSRLDIGRFTLAAALLCLAISGQSLWIDEGLTAWLAAPLNVDGLRTAMSTISHGSSQPLEPLYHFYLWICAALFGMKEWGLRAANIPFALLLVISLSWTSRIVSNGRNIWVLCAASPFLWFYMNEARPYMAIAACVTLSIAALLSYVAGGVRYRKAAPWICIIAFWIACCFSLVSVYAGVPLLLLAWLEGKRHKLQWREFARDWQWGLIASLPLFAVLGVYCRTMLGHGGYGMVGRSGMANIAFSLYEFLGFAGLGPPRNDLRMGSLIESFHAYWQLLTLGILAWFSIVAVVLDLLLLQRIGGRLRNLAIVFAAGFICAVGFSIALHHQFWGRHLMALFPFFLITIMQLLCDHPQHSITRTCQVVALLLLGIAWGLSCYRLRFVTPYAKDDYRTAVAKVLDVSRSRPSRIVWVADNFTARYYGLASDDRADWSNALPISRVQAVATASEPQSFTKAQASTYLRASSSPLVVAVSRPDLFDPEGAWSGSLTACAATPIASLNAFRIFYFDPAMAPAIGCNDGYEPHPSIATR